MKNLGNSSLTKNHSSVLNPAQSTNLIVLAIGAHPKTPDARIAEGSSIFKVSKYELALKEVLYMKWIKPNTRQKHEVITLLI